MIEEAPNPDCVLCGAPGPESLTGIEGYFHCPTCDVRFLHPSRRLDRPAEESRYHLHQNNLEDPKYRDFLEPLCTAITARVQAGRNGLDFGCGPGPLLAKMLGEAGFAMQTYDPLFQPQLPQPGTRFDFITASEVVEHLFSPLCEFSRLRSWLKPGGWLGVMTSLVEPRTDFINWHYRRDPTHVVFYSRRSFVWLAGQLGFTDLAWAGDRVVLLRRAEYDGGT